MSDPTATLIPTSTSPPHIRPSTSPRPHPLPQNVQPQTQDCKPSTPERPASCDITYPFTCSDWFAHFLHPTRKVIHEGNQWEEYVVVPTALAALWPEVVPRNRGTFLAGITADYTCLDGRDFFPAVEDVGKEVIAKGGDVSGGELDVGVKAAEEARNLWEGHQGFWVLRDPILHEIFYHPCEKISDLPSGKRVEEQRRLTVEGDLFVVYTDSGNVTKHTKRSKFHPKHKEYMESLGEEAL